MEKHEKTNGLLLANLYPERAPFSLSGDTINFLFVSPDKEGESGTHWMPGGRFVFLFEKKTHLHRPFFYFCAWRLLIKRDCKWIRVEDQR